jgi:polar amino acid transport system ATP-binding protein
MAYLEIKDFYKSFGDVEVLKGINLEIKKGEVVTIIGSSGSGKTTLLRCINFLEKADGGVMTLNEETLFDANDAEKYSEKELREKRLNFGLVFQSFNLFPQYNVLDNITLAPKLLVDEQAKAYKKELKLNAKLGEINKKEIGKKLNDFVSSKKEEIVKKGEELLETVGLTDKKNSYPCELSGGQSQRVAIARALALNPKVLCFDEPTSALDPELTGEVLKVIKSLKQKDRTMIIVTHEMGFAKSVSDKVVFMAEGVVEEMGKPKEIFENPKSEKLKVFLTGINNKDGE